jgi:DNA (cytosine-5)-methyltransferase 1
MLAAGMAYLVDESRAHQLRQVGNGVVAAQAGVAFAELLRRAGLT